jgi:hypothetical protein
MNARLDHGTSPPTPRGRNGQEVVVPDPTPTDAPWDDVEPITWDELPEDLSWTPTNNNDNNKDDA